MLTFEKLYSFFTVLLEENNYEKESTISNIARVNGFGHTFHSVIHSIIISLICWAMNIGDFHMPNSLDIVSATTQAYACMDAR